MAIGDESARAKTRRRREERVDHVFEIPFNQSDKPSVTCPDCGESMEIGIYGGCEVSYDSCWGLDCDSYHKFVRDRDAETYDDENEDGTVQTQLVTDGGVTVQSTLFSADRARDQEPATIDDDGHLRSCPACPAEWPDWDGTYGKSPLPEHLHEYHWPSDFGLSALEERL